jgi:uncharacterized protein (DUF2249 family)
MPSGQEEGDAMTIAETEAHEAMRAHHRLLSEQLSGRAAAVAEAVTAGRPHEAAVADMVTYLAEEVLPHAAAEEETIYPAAYPAAAAADGDLVSTVNEMAAEHGTLSAAAKALAGLANASAAADRARQIADLFAAHAARENEVLLPALLASDDVDLAALLAQMHLRAEDAAKKGRTGNNPARDPQAALLGLLLEAGRALARAGQADLASQLTAAAWAALREDRPDLAVTVTAALHGLTRRIGAGPAQGGQAAGAGQRAQAFAGTASEPELDVRDLAPAQHHETISAAYDDLAPGQGFILINDHDPRPLRYQFEAQCPGEFTWDYLEAGPKTWRVRIGRPGA